MFKPTIIFTLTQSEQVTKPKGSHDSFVEMTDEVSIFEVHSICPHMGECSVWGLQNRKKSSFSVTTRKTADSFAPTRKVQEQAIPPCVASHPVVPRCLHVDVESAFASWDI